MSHQRHVRTPRTHATHARHAASTNDTGEQRARHTHTHTHATLPLCDHKATFLGDSFCIRFEVWGGLFARGSWYFGDSHQVT